MFYKIVIIYVFVVLIIYKHFIFLLNYCNANILLVLYYLTN